MRTLSGSELAIGFYPKFIYNSSGGGGIARASASSIPGRTNLEFDPESVSIPDVTGQSSETKVYVILLAGRNDCRAGLQISRSLWKTREGLLSLFLKGCNLSKLLIYQGMILH